MKENGTRKAARTSLALTVRELMDKYIYRIDLDADYQREKVWSQKDQERLLDSIIKGIDIPKLYLAETRDNKQFDYECIDGKQRLLTVSSFMNPEKSDSDALLIDVLNKRYTFKQLQKQHPSIAKSIEKYTLDFVLYDKASLTEGFVQEIFRRLQLGIRLNSGEILNSHIGTMRHFVFKKIGKDGPFLRRTKLSDKRYSRQFTLAQICINSFHRAENREFVRARLQDLEDFFAEKSSISKNDVNLVRIRKVLKLMDAAFAGTARSISSRAVAVSAYLFCEELATEKKASLITKFAKYYINLLDTIEGDMELVSQYKKPKHPMIMDRFQKYVLQASVEPYSIRRRDEFLKGDFARYLKGKE